MGRRALTLSLLLVPAAGLGALGLVLVAAAPARAGAAGVGAPAHFAVRQLVVLGCSVALGLTVARLGPRRLLAASPLIFLAALALTLAVFAPGIGVRAGGARRWIHLGPLSGGPAPFLIGAVALLVAAARQPRARRLAVAGALCAVLALVIEPDFSAAAIALAVAFAALAGGGVAGHRLRLLPAAGLLLVVLGFAATRFGYVDDRIRGFLAPESDRRGKGFEVLALAHANAAGATHAAGLGRGATRHRLSSPASDYAFAVVGEELGVGGRLAVVGAWLAIAAGIVLSSRAPAARRDPAVRAAAIGVGAALAAPAALHIAVCRGWLPIIGVTMPLVSYDPALTVAAGAELGLLAAVALGHHDEEPIA
ncbi:MAG TPA: FtsW/RodA/SpoVE family cell cycle protein [Polyangia bacterium]|nr:FtsW/RodA/SpoVE family cell cycle protein [Polyangia bacterium]